MLVVSQNCPPQPAVRSLRGLLSEEVRPRAAIAFLIAIALAKVIAVEQRRKE